MSASITALLLALSTIAEETPNAKDSAQITVIKSTDSQGNTVFSDTARAGEAHEEIIIRTSNIVERSSKYQATTEEVQTGNIYKKCDLVSPVNGDEFNYQEKSIGAVLSLSPKLREQDYVQFIYDGRPQNGNDKSLTTHIADVRTGKHTIGANVVDQLGNILCSSSDVAIDVVTHTPRTKSNTPRNSSPSTIKNSSKQGRND